jgi:hypothetical protein
MIGHMKAARVLVIRADGTVSAEWTTLADLLGPYAGRYRLVEGSPGTLVLQTIDPDNQERGRVLAAGEIVSRSTVLEIVSAAAQNGWHGELAVIDDDIVRRITIDQGALKSAFSNSLSERLGEVMVSLGAITRDQLARCVLQATESKRFGEIALDQGYIDRQKLFAMLQAQAERIFQNALLVAGGRYTFTISAEEDDAPVMTLHMPIQNLLLESVQRIDEMALFRERIPSSAMCPVITEAAGRKTLSESLRPVAQLADGTQSIVDIARMLHLGEFEVTKIVMQLLQIGFVELRDRQTLNRESVERIIKQLNDVMREILDTVERHGGKKEMLWTLQQWVRDAPIMDYFGPKLQLDMPLSPEATLRQLEVQQLDRPLESLHRAAHELVSFAMFSAAPTLPREAERALSKWVNQRLSKLKL